MSFRGRFVGSAVVQKYRKGSEKIKKCKTKIQKSIILTKCISFCRICRIINRRGAKRSQQFAKGSQMEANKGAKGSQKRACKSQTRTEGSQKGAKVCQTGAKRKRKGDPGASWGNQSATKMHEQIDFRKREPKLVIPGVLFWLLKSRQVDFHGFWEPF